MNRSARRLTVARRTLLVAATAGGLAFAAAAPLAAADAAPARVAAAASPGTGVPVLGGLIDSVVGIVTGTTYGIAGAAGAVVCSVVPVCPTVLAS
jgi:hypothetical protein